MKKQPEPDRVIWRPDLYTLLGVGGSCVTKWIKAGKLPAFGWRWMQLRC